MTAAITNEMKRIFSMAPGAIAREILRYKQEIAQLITQCRDHDTRRAIAMEILAGLAEEVERLTAENARLAAVIEEAKRQEPVAWLIECPAHSERPAMWLTLTTFEKKYLSDCGLNHYTFVAKDALKFADKFSAEEYVRHNRIKDVLVTEHIFYGDAAPIPTEPKP